MIVDRSLKAAMKATVAYVGLGSDGNSIIGCSSCCRALVLLLVGFVIGVLINQYGFLHESIHVDVKVTSDGAELSDNERLQLVLSNLPHINWSLPSDVADPMVVIPDIVHYFWFPDDDAMMLSQHHIFSFINYLSIYSTLQQHRPHAIWLHCNRLPAPADEWWLATWKNIPLTIVHHEHWAPAANSAAALSVAARRRAQIAAIVEVLAEHGGIYIDWSVVVMRRLEPLLHHAFCIGRSVDLPDSIDFLSARRNSSFVRLMLTAFRSGFRDFAEEADELFRQRPELLPANPFCFEHHQTLAVTLGANDDLPQRQTFVVRIPHELQGITDVVSIRGLNTLYGAAMRYIYYGSSKMLM